MKKIESVIDVLGYFSFLIILGAMSIIVAMFVGWQIIWVVEMQKLSWQIKVAEVAQFTCKPKLWQADNLRISWNCYEYD